MPQVLVVVSSRHGATRGIAERLQATLEAAGLPASLADAREAPSPDAFDALVIGGAAYMGKWLEPVTAYLHRHREAISRRPTWLFSSGPIGTDRVDGKGHDLLAPPPFLTRAAEEVGARGTRVFFGRWDPADPPMTVAERLFRRLPIPAEVLPIGDFRDWPAIEEWAREIAGELREPAAAG